VEEGRLAIARKLADACTNFEWQAFIPLGSAPFDSTAAQIERRVFLANWRVRA
jgi:hypothetical protein